MIKKYIKIKKIIKIYISKIYYLMEYFELYEIAFKFIKILTYTQMY